MENGIEVGEYIRTVYGDIAQYIKEIPKNEDVEDGMIFDDYIYKKHKCIRYSFLKDIIVKHSKDLLDLVEIGDYVNEERIIEKWDTRVGSIRSNFYEEDIETILTKEKYMANCYKVGGRNKYVKNKRTE